MTLRTEPLRLALAQINATVGDIDGNSAEIRSRIAEGRAADADLVVFPELALTGYPPEDLLLKPAFLDAAGAALRDLAAETSEGPAALVGFPERTDDVYNAAALLAGGEVAAVFAKMVLPNYGVFDEQRHFQAGAGPAMFELNGVAIGVSVCEDLWEPGPPASLQALAGAQVLVNLSASPYHAGKPREREAMLVQRARDNRAVVAFCNLVGGQDELVFDGHSVVADHTGVVRARGPGFEQAMVLCTVDPGAVAAERLRDTRHRAAVRRQRELGGPAVPVLASVSVERDGSPPEPGGAVAELLEPEAEVYAALTTGVRDYVEKNGFERVVVGLSGGIDSALTALVAADAVGGDRLACAVMPSRYSSEGTQADARSIAANLGAHLVELEIDDAMRAYDAVLSAPFAGTEPDVTEENLQARIRGNLLMALSNKFGWLVLTTGNKSEMSVGYATLYGDMAGGFAVLKDVFKERVYRLVRWRNARSERDLVPAGVLDRAPSAELRPDQRDEDSLPPYELLDRILAGYVEQDLDARQLILQGLPAAEVERVIALVDAAEYKRRQAPPGVRISTKGLGRDRRLPVTNRWAGRRG